MVTTLLANMLENLWSLSDMSYIAHCCAVINDRTFRQDTGTGKDHAWKVRVGDQVSNASRQIPVWNLQMRISTGNCSVDALNTIGMNKLIFWG